MHTVRTIAAVVLLAGGCAVGLSAQEVGQYQGFSIGGTRSHQVWKPKVDTSNRSGFLANYFTDVPSPLGPFRIRVGAGYAQRGGWVEGDFDGEPLTGQTRSEWLSMHLELKLVASLGSFHAFAAAGPAYSLHLRTRQDAILGQVLFEEQPKSFSVTGSGGVGFTLASGRVAELEARWVEGLTTARSGSFVKVRDQSLELMLRIGRVKVPS